MFVYKYPMLLNLASFYEVLLCKLCRTLNVYVSMLILYNSVYTLYNSIIYNEDTKSVIHFLVNYFLVKY